MSENEIILEINVQYEDAVRAIAEYSAKVEECRKVQEELKKSFDEGAISENDFREGMAAAKIEIDTHKKAIQLLEKEVRNGLKADREKAGSLDQLKAQLSISTAAYNKLSEAERNEAKGLDLQKKIADITQKLKDAEEALGNHRRSVGDYEKATRSLRTELKDLVAQMAQMTLEGKNNTAEFEALRAKAGEMRDAIDDTNESIRNTASDTSNFDGLMEGLGAAIGGFGLLQSAIGLADTENKMFEETMKKLQVVITALNSLQAIQNALQKQSAALTFAKNIQTQAAVMYTNLETAAQSKNIVIKTAATAAQWLLNAAMSANPVMLLVLGIGLLVGALTLFSSSSSRATNEANRQNEAFRAMQKTNDEYLESLKNRGETEEKIIGDTLRLRREEMDAALKISNSLQGSSKQKQEADEKAKNSIETYNDSLNVSLGVFQKLMGEQDRMLASAGKSDYEKAVDKVTQRYREQKVIIQELSKDVRYMTTEGKASLAEMNAAALTAQNLALEALKNEESKKQAAEAKKRAEERAKTELEITRKLEDETLKALTDARARATQQLAVKQQRELEDLRKSYGDKSKLTKTAAEQLAALEAAMIERQAAESKQLTDQLNERDLADQLAFEQKKVQAQIDAARAGTQEELDARMASLQQKREAELAANAQLAEDKRIDEALINARYDNEELETKRTHAQKVRDAVAAGNQAELDRRLTAAELENQTEVQMAQIRLEAKQAELNALLAMDAETKAQQYASEVEYNDAVLRLRSEMKAADKSLTDAQIGNIQKISGAVSMIGGAYSSMFNEIGDDSVNWVIFQKMTGLAQLAITEALAIAEAIRTATAGDPYTVAIRIASAVAAVVGGIAGAFKSINSAKAPNKPKFHEGGTVGGSGEVAATLMAGESVMTQRATAAYAPLLSALNQSVGGAPVNIPTQGIEIASRVQMELTPESITALAEANRNIHPVVSVQEIADVTSRVSAVEQTLN
jgi:hypothetical protein